MASGRSNKLVGQTGEYLVAAELSRRGLIATTFTGNVPHYDIIASNESGEHVSVQVKASSGSKWQFGNVLKYFDVTFEGHKQIVGDPQASPVRDLIMAFVSIRENGQDLFYILTWNDFCDLLIKHYATYLNQHNGVRPRKWKSLHATIQSESLVPYRDQWDTVAEKLR